ncbi:MAG: glycosyltransferase [Propionibacterium sp.]|nr:glycosyltransferase [Propionibacterium sp.]
MHTTPLSPPLPAPERTGSLDEFGKLLATTAHRSPGPVPTVGTRDDHPDDDLIAVVDGGDLGGRQEETTRTRGPSPSLMALVFLATLGVIAYATFLLNPAHRGDTLPYLLIVVAEAIVILNALLAMWTILSSGYDPHDSSFHHASNRLFDPEEIVREGIRDHPEAWPMHLGGRPVTVEVFITACGEPVDVLRRTVTATLAMTGRHRTWILDDGRSDEVAALAQELGARYVRRPTSNGAKAGNVNYALTLAKGALFAILDADFVPRPDMLTEMVPFFADRTVAFVQGPQVYGNMDNVISRGAGYMQTVFYRFIQTGRNQFNAAFCVGTNVVFRREAVTEIGGMYTGSKSEDVWTSILLHERGWRSIYIARTVAVGDTPDTIESYLKQQTRWATGGFELLFTHFPWSPRRRLTVDQRIQYGVTSTFYLTGIMPLVLLIVPPMQIFLDLAPIAASTSVATWVVFYLGFYGTQVLVAFFSMGSFRWEVFLLSIVTFPAYVKALWSALTVRDQVWQATGAKRRATSPFAHIVPQILTAVFLLLTSAVGAWKLGHTTDGALALVWNGVNTVIFLGFLLQAFAEGRRSHRSPRTSAPAPSTTAGAEVHLPGPESAAHADTRIDVTALPAFPAASAVSAASEPRATVSPGDAGPDARRSPVPVAAPAPAGIPDSPRFPSRRQRALDDRSTS